MSLELRTEIRITNTNSVFIVHMYMWVGSDDDSGFKQGESAFRDLEISSRASLKQYISRMHSFLDEFGGNW